MANRELDFLDYFDDGPVSSFVGLSDRFGFSYFDVVISSF
jgi:hypothetical protein